MSAPFPFGYTVEVERGARNQHGDVDWAVHHEIPGCAWAPRYSNENDQSQTRIITGLALYGPYGVDLLATDRVVLPAVPELPADRKQRIYRVVGDIGNWRSPFTGWAPGFEAALERVA